VTRAYVHACLRDERSCQSDLDTAAEQLDQAGEGERSDYIDFYDATHLHKWASHALLRLAQGNEALLDRGRRAADDALAQWPRSAVRESAEVIGACAAARIAQREIEEAAELVGRAYVVAVGTCSARNTRRILELRNDLSPYRDTRAVRDLDDQLLFGGWTVE
jgi:hypothetical protein